MQAVKDYLALTGMTQARLAKKANLTPQTLNHYLKRRIRPGIASLCKISEATGIGIDKLVEGR